MKRNKIECEICNQFISKSNIKKHINSKNCLKHSLKKSNNIKINMTNIIDGKIECPICYNLYSKYGISNHILKKHTESNCTYVKQNLVAWNKGLTKETDHRVKKFAETHRANIKSGKTIVKGCCTKEWNQSEQGRKSSSKGGGFRENAGRSKKFKVKDSYNNEVVLQSSYELECMNILNLININWSRPKALKYKKDGIIRNYFGDFLLNDFNIILDPKNSFKAKLDEEKIKLVNEYNKIKVIILLKEQITKEFIELVIKNI